MTIRELREAVERGQWPVAFNDELPLKIQTVAELAEDAYHGDLNAAKALHEAVLPGWTLDAFGQRAGGWVATLGRRDSKTPVPAPSAMVRDTPARAWLLAVLKALEAQEDT